MSQKTAPASVKGKTKNSKKTKQVNPRFKNRPQLQDNPGYKSKFLNEGYWSEGNKAAEYWTEQKAIEALDKVISVLATDDDTQQVHPNMVRANTIKLKKEACLVAGITNRNLMYFFERFGWMSKTDDQGQVVKNANWSPAVSELLKIIDDVCESRLNYSGLGMDIFILKNHYGYRDSTELDMTTKGQAMPAAPNVTIIERP